ncbi:MAG: MBL fold metallo-hydrolase [Alphaproteobacteria bacterium]
MRVTILGCGPSGGVPLVGCDCPVCTSKQPRNRRSRPSIAVEQGDTRLLIDAGPDLREQLLASGLSRFDAVFLSHEHADHTNGMDDLRSINFQMGRPLDVYSSPKTLELVQQRFGYAFEPNLPDRGWYKPELVPRALSYEPVTIGDIEILPFSQDHGPLETLGFRFGDVAYSTDTNGLSESAFEALDGVGLWIVDCLRPGRNPMHAHLDLSLEWIARVKPKRAILTHMNHEFDYHDLAASLPEGVEPAYDGMVVEW